jgi:Fur family ferric uptake transcriptional regulator
LFGVQDNRDVDCVIGTGPCLDAGNTDGVTVDEVEVTFWSCCTDCQQRRNEIKGEKDG